MEDHLAALHQALFPSGDEAAASSTTDRLDPFLVRPASGDSPVKLGLRELLLILKCAVSPSPDAAPRPSYQLWSDAQLQAVVSLGLAVVSAARSLPLDQVEPVVVVVVQRLLEFAVCYLDNSEFKGEEFSTESHVLLLMELALYNGVDTPHDLRDYCALSSLQDIWKTVPCNLDGREVDDCGTCGLQGTICSKGEEAVDRLLMSFASESSQERQDPGSCRPSKHQDSFALLCQHWAVVHVDSIQRLMRCCNKLIRLLDMSDENAACPQNLKRLSFSLRTFQLLRRVSEELPLLDQNACLLHEVVSCTNAIPCLFRTRVDIANNHVNVEGSLENVLLLLLEEFLCLTKVIFCSGRTSLNIQACILASMVGNLDSSLWRYNKDIANPKPPLVYSPQTVLYMLKLVKDLKKLSNQIHDIKHIDEDDIGSSIHCPSCHVHSEEVPLLKTLTDEELLKMVFVPSIQWMDNLMHLLLFLHNEGMKLRPRLEKAQPSVLKAIGSADPETTVPHDDEALFGNLFSEGSRSICSVDDQSAAAVDSCSSASNINMPIQAASELLSFIKDCVFSCEWAPSLFADACKMLGENHIDVLLSVLNSQVLHSEGRSSDSCGTFHEDKKLSYIQELCFDLLQNLLTCHTLTVSLEGYLIDRILEVEDGNFLYNTQTLCLLAYAIASRVGLSGSQLRAKLYKNFVDFMVDKAANVCSRYPNLEELFGSLPSVFHMEIVLMAFHLSSEIEKGAFAKLVLAALQTVDSPPSTSSCVQLTCWAFVVSRLILLLRHMVAYPLSIPSSLLINLKSKWREAPTSSLHQPKVAHNQNSSWASLTLKNIMGPFLEEEPFLSSLVGQLIEVPAFPPLLFRDKSAVESLQLSWNEVCAVFTKILGLWRGRKASCVEDLVVERYLFSLCSDINMMACAHHFSPQDVVKSQDLLDMACFFRFSCSVVGGSDGLLQPNFLDMVIGVLHHLCASNIPENVEELGWDFLRNGLWLSSILSLFNVGICGYCMKNKLSEVSPFWIEKTADDCSYTLSAESLISSLIETGRAPMLLGVLSSLLSNYLRVYQRAFFSTLNRKSDSSVISSVLLLKHSCLEGCQLDELLKNSGVSSQQLESVLDLVHKLAAVVNRGAAGVRNQVFWECLLHGFPSHLQVSSAVLVSSIVSIKGIASILDKFCRVEHCRKDICLDKEVLQQIVESMMTIKFDKVFQGLHGESDAIIGNLFGETGISGRGNLFLLKQMQEFLSDFNAMKLSDSYIFEWIIVKTIDTVESLRKNILKSNMDELHAGGDDVLESVSYLQEVDLTLLLSSFDHCFSETMNAKVLNFFAEVLSEDMSPSFKLKIEEKLLEMDLLHLSKWLEVRLLGSIVESDTGVFCAKGNSLSLRETTMKFILSLTTLASASQPGRLHDKIFEALLQLLDNAFLLFDLHIAMSFIHFVVQLATRETLMRLFLNKILLLVEKLAGDEHFLPGVKSLFEFLGTVLSGCGSPNNTSGRSSGKSLPSNSFAAGSAVLTSVGGRRNSEHLVFSANQEAASRALEYDATSMDEDEDDGTSDGEVASIDKDEEEDSNSEKALASKVCTFTSSGSNFMEQHWYFCYTCDLTISKGCCSICAKVCHRGHRVVYSRSSRFFCDCGAGGVRGSNCQCLKPRKFTGSDSGPNHLASNFQSLFPFSEEPDPENDSDLDEEVNSDADTSSSFSVPRELNDRVAVLLEELDVEDRVLKLCLSLLPSITSRRDGNFSKDKRIILGEDKVLSYGTELLQLKKAYKGGSFDLKIKTDYYNTKDLRSHLACGSLVKSLLSVSSRGRLAVGEGDKVAIYDVGQLIGQATVAPVTADKNNAKPVSRNIVRFEIVHLAFNSVVENYLAVAGYEDCQVLTLSPRGEVTDRLAIELALQGAYIRRIDWVPGSQVKLMVVTNRFIKIYDLSQDNISPLHYFTVPDDMIVDATLLMASQGRMFLIVLSEKGCLFKLELAVEGNVGATPLKDVIQMQGQEINAKGSSLYFSFSLKILFVSYEDGTTMLGRFSHDVTSLKDISLVFEEEDGKIRSAGLNRWKELLVGSGLFVCLSTVKQNAPLAISMEPHQLHAQNMRYTLSSTLHMVGLAAYKPLSKDKVHCLVLHDDGSLQIYSHIPSGTDYGANVTAEKVKKLGSGILKNKAYAGIKPEFPLDFFENTICITADVKLGGDAIRNGDSEVAKQSLASEDGFLESPTYAGFKVSVSNSNPDIVMVGFRVHVGNTSVNHIPTELTVFQRIVKLDEGMRSWYDVPFTVAESLLADEEFTISVGPTFKGTTAPRIDSLEIYGRAKDEFGWKEKMDALLDMESRVLGGKSLLGGSGKKCQSLPPSLIQEQVVADGLKILSTIYSRHKLQEDEMKEDSTLKCKMLLEIIFESDREQWLQSAACRVLRAAFPSKERYYQVKDNMRLRGVLKLTSVLKSRLGAGGNSDGWIIEEFTAQMRAVSKIALHRRSNLATFLEMNGSEVIDGLMQVLWGILDFEQPDTQTMNSIIISSVELIYCYAECLALHGKDSVAQSVAPAVLFFKKLLFFPNEAVQTSSSLAISSRLLQVPFPKQTMLTTDDPVDSTASALSTEATTGGNAQVMIEEDSITSSVQYCCDGCSTVPILRRRWHCTVCPDFDLCEACYQVLDADRLPSPHSRDHPMTAIPIEVESLGDGSEIHFSTDETNDSRLLPVAADASLQNSGSSIHVLEPTHSGGFSTSMADAVSISASKQAVNSFILSELLEQLKGWMKTTSGLCAIPIMQLFYRLSSAAGGPFIDGSKPEILDLEKLIRWFLDEIDLSKPFGARSRSSFGEVTILVFMFFTLMLRNWHQPGNDSISKSSGNVDTLDRNVVHVTSASSQPSIDSRENNDLTSQLLQACSCLRNQTFVNYLMDILQQLMHLFKNSDNFETLYSSNTGSGCGALLTVRRDLPAGNFSPFFSDSYAKSHRADLFMDYHRLLLENAFRLVYSLVRPEKHDKVEKEKVGKISSGKDLKLDGYQEVLCSYINNPHTTFVRRYARRLFLHLCGSKTHYYSVRDSWQFSSEVKKLYKHINKSGGLQNVVSYERSVKIVKCLTLMAEVAAARPRNWQKYCLKHGDILPFLMNAVFYFGEESVIQTLKLLNLAFYTGKDSCHSMQKVEAGDRDTTGNSNKPVTQSTDSKKKKKSDDGSEDKSCIDMEAAVDIFNEKSGSCSGQFIDCFLLEWNSSSVRVEAKCVLHGAWHHGKYSFKEALLASLLQRVKSLPMYGQNIVEFTELLSWLLGKTPNDNGAKQQNTELVDRCLTSDVVSGIFETLHSQNELIANHPNSRIYNTLTGLVEFDGYYLESEPCVSCSSPEVPYSRMKLESLKSETKFTDNRIIVKCTGSYTIQAVTMNVHDARKSKSVKVLNLYYNNRPVADLSELKNNWSLWKRAKSCHLAFNQTEVKVEFPIPITACNFMIELDSFYENLQALSLEPLQCPRCSRPVTDKHGICGNCHENAYQCRQCRNINYENLDSFLCNECGYSKYGRFEFNFMAKPSFTFDNMENDEDMKRGLAAIESESENAHKRYQQLLGFKKPLLKLVSSIGENEMDSQQKDSVQQMMVSLPGPSCKINRKIALLGVLYGEKCKAAFDSVSKSVQTLQGLRRVLMNYLYQKHSENNNTASRFVVSRSPNNCYGCYGCATTFVVQCLEILQVLSKRPSTKNQLVTAGILSELFENNIHQGPKSARVQARAVLCAFSEGDNGAVTELNNLIQKKVMYCLEHHRSMDIALATREELLLLSEVCTLADEFWESRLRVVFQLLFSSIKSGAKHPAIAEQIILPCLRIISQACTPPKPDSVDKEQETGNSALAMQPKDENSTNVFGSLSGVVTGSKNVPEPSEKTWNASQKTQDIQLLSYSEWEKGASYLDFVRRQYKVTQTVKGSGQRSRSQRQEYLALKYILRWKRHSSKTKSDLSVFELGSWVTELILSACSQSIRSEMCMLISLLCAESSSRRFRLLNLLLALLPATLTAGESAAEYFDLLFKMIDSEDARLFLTVRGCLTTICKLITQEVSNVEALERSLRIDISQGFILHKLMELLGKFLEVPNIRSRFMRDNLLTNVLEALIVIRGLIVQKTKLISDCNFLLKDLLDGLLVESGENKRQFVRACIRGLQNHGEEMKARTSLFILEQLCNLICPSKAESIYLLILNKAHTQEEFIRGSMTKNPYSSAEIGPLMRDVKNKICHQLDLLGLLEDDYGMELLVAGNIISLDLSIAQVYELVWMKSNSQTSSSVANSSLLSSTSATSSRDCPPMIVTYRLQGLDGEATEPMIKELEEDREESQDPEVEFAIAGAVREYGGLEILMDMIQRLRDDLKSNQEQLVAVLNLLMHCCKIRENRQALLQLGALGLLLETARRAFSVDAMEPADGILLIVESLTMEANESDNISITQGALTFTSGETGTGEQAKKVVLMFLERLSHPLGLKKSNKQQRNTEMVARILPYLTYGEPAAMEALIQHFDPYLQNWKEFDRLQTDCENNPKDEIVGQKAAQQRFTVENFVRVSESLKTSSCGERLKDIILEKGIADVAVRHISESFAIMGQAGFKSTAEWSSGLKLPSVPLILSMLRGLSMGHLPTQECIDKSGILPLLHTLEGVPGENEIGARAENLLDTLSDKEAKGDGFLEEKVRKLRHATRDEMRRRALRKREELLQGLGFRQELSLDGGERIVVAQPILEGFEDVEEEKDGLACMVCREGYSLRPTDLLGVYSYSKRVNLGVGTSGSARGECVYTTVSYFNIIHFQCHQEAKRADAALRNPKKEWEGATLRNNESLCNSLFPVRGPSVPLLQYIRYVDQYWDNLNALGRADGSRLRLLTYDIVLMLARFATGASFSTESRGGGRESNSRFLPFMVQMARHLLEQGSPSQRLGMAKAVLSYIGPSGADSRSPTHVAQPAQGTEETVQFMMVNSLLSESYDSWLQHRRVFLQRGIYHAYMQHTHGRSSSRTTTTTGRAEAGSMTRSVTVEGNTGEELLSITRPMLVYTGLIEQLQRFFKVKKSANVPAPRVEGTTGGSVGDDEGGTMEPWEVVMKERLLNAREMVGFSKELLTWLDEMNSATDLQEAFDVIGVLADVLSGGIARCEDFVHDAINAGKS